MNIREMMMSIPGSYDDFVNCIVRWTNKDEKIKDAILAQMRDFPDSSSSDVLGVLWNCLGIGEPLEIVDDDEPVRKPFKVAML